MSPVEKRIEGLLDITITSGLPDELSPDIIEALIQSQKSNRAE